MFVKDWKKDIFTIPNLLSLFRLLLIPVYIVIYLNAEDTTDYYLAAGILTVSCLTDLIDGKIARHFNMITSLGKLLDPVADKATQFALILCLTMKHKVLRYIMALFILKEGFQLIAGGILLRKKKMLKGALISGKVCTTVLFISLILMVMLPELNHRIINTIATVDLAFMLIAFAEYIAAYFFMEDKFQSLED
jgi:cardiolipin synthase